MHPCAVYSLLFFLLKEEKKKHKVEVYTFFIGSSRVEADVTSSSCYISVHV